MLKPPQQQALKAHVRPLTNGQFQVSTNTEMNKFLVHLHRQYPECFQDDKSKHKRVFFDEPATTIPYLKVINRISK